MKQKILSPEFSFKGFNIWTFLKNNKVKLLAILISLLGSIVVEYPELAAMLSGFIILLEQVLKYFMKEIKN
jgi:hypothetical protein